MQAPSQWVSLSPGIQGKTIALHGEVLEVSIEDLAAGRVAALVESAWAFSPVLVVVRQGLSAVTTPGRIPGGIRRGTLQRSGPKHARVPGRGGKWRGTRPRAAGSGVLVR